MMKEHDDDTNQTENEQRLPCTTRSSTNAPVAQGNHKPNKKQQQPHHQAASSSSSSWKAVGLYIFSFCTVSVSSGLVYGYPSLRRQLVNVEGSTLSEDSLGIIITTGAWSTQSLRFFYGVARDRCCGTARTTVVSLVCCAAGCLDLALSNADNATALTASMFLVGMGSGTQLCLQPVAGMFAATIQGTLIASLSGAFQIAGLVFVALTSATENRKASFGGLVGVLLCFAGVGYAILPIKKFVPREKQSATVEEDDDDDDVYEDDKPESSTNGEMEDREEDDKKIEQQDGEDEETCLSTSPQQQNEQRNEQLQTEENDTEDSIWVSLLSAEYMLLLIWFTIQLVPMQYYVATIGYQLEEKGDNDGKYTRIFSIVYAAAAPAAPLCGKIADMFGLGIAQACSTMLAAFSLFFLSIDDTISLSSHTVGMVAYGVGRMFVFGNYFTNVGKRFGYHNYGTLTGLGLLLSGIVSLIQYPMIATATDGGATWVNIGSGIAMVGTLPYCVWLALREHRERKQQS